MKKYLLLTALFYLLSLAFTTVSFAEYRYGDSDYTYSNDASKWSSNISCKTSAIPVPQKKVDILALDDNGLSEYYAYGTGPDNDINIYAEVYSDINWCGMEWRGERPPILHTKIIFKQNDLTYAEFNGEIQPETWALNNGKLTFANGEVWSIDDRESTIVVPSSAKLKLKLEIEKREQAERIENVKREQAARIEYEKREKIEKIEREKREQLQKEKEEKDHKIYVQKVDKFRKTLKPGTEVRLNIGDYMGRGFVLKTTKDAAEVQVNYLWVSGNRVPSGKRVWINKRELEPI